MRRKNFLCKMTAFFLSAVMVVTCTTVSDQTQVFAAEMKLTQNDVAFGSAGTELSAGEYSLPVSLKNASDITKDSMAASCVKDGKMIVNKDGTADITIGLQAVSVFNTTAWAEQWKIYEEKTAEDESKKTVEYTTNEEGNVDSITFRLPSNAIDGVYTDMYVSAMNTTMSAYFAFDFANAAASGGGDTVEKKTGSAKVEQFGGYDVNVVVSVQDGKIVDIEVEGSNFEGTHADYNQTKLQAAAEGLKAAYAGKSATDAKEIEGVDAVSSATYSSNAIQTAVLDALGLEAASEVINLPAEKLAEGTYQVEIAFYTDNVKHSLVENDKAKATITVDAEGTMTLTSAVINGTEKEPLYFYEFNGYYEGNDEKGTLKATDKVKKEDIEFTDDVFGADEKVVTEVSFPLEGEFAAIYRTNASIYVPAMKNLTGEVGGVLFDRGRFSSDCFAKIYWDSLKKVESTGSTPSPTPAAGTNTPSPTPAAGANTPSPTADAGVKTPSPTADAGAKTPAPSPVDGTNTPVPSQGTGFGSLGKELEAGTYTLPIGMKNAADITKDSMAGSCLQGAAITVSADGSAKVTVDLTAVSVMGQTAWASDWKIFKEQNTSSDTVDAEVTKTDADGNVTQIAFTLPNNHADGVYVSMNAMGGRVMQAYLAFDFASAVKQKETLADGVYAVTGTMYKPDLVTKSMADTAFHHDIQMTVKDGRATLTVNFKGMAITGIQGYLGGLKYYDTGYSKDANNNPTGNLKEVTVESVQKYSDGVVISDNYGKDYPDVVHFELIPEAMEDGIVPLQVFVPVMESITAGTGNQNVYLKLDLDSMEKTTAEDERFLETEEAPKNPAAYSGTNTPSPSPDAGTNTPSPTPDAGTNTPSPTPDAGTNTQGPAPAVGTNAPGNDGGTPSASPSPEAKAENTVKAGQTFKVKGHTYKVTAKGKAAFIKCKKNAKRVTIPATVKVKGVTCKVTSVSGNAFKNNKKLTSVVLGKNVSKVEKNAFKGCKKLKTVKLPKGLSKSKKAAFMKQIRKAGISSKVKMI